MSEAAAGNGEGSSTSTGERGMKKYKGVRRRKWGKWVSEIRLPNSRERVWLGSYDAPDKAARAFDAAFVCLRGPNADLNFPDSPPPLTRRLHAVNPQEVQAAALSHANRRAGPSAVVSASDESSRPMATDDVAACEDDWRPPAMAPLYSPTGWPGCSGNAYDFLQPVPPAPFGGDDDDAEDYQAGSGHGAGTSSLWSFDP